MKTHGSFRWLFILSVAILIAGCAKKQADMPTDGTLTTQYYTNKYFGFVFQIPKGWVVAEQSANDTTQKVADKATKETLI